MTEIKQGDKCSFEGCEVNAEVIACGRGIKGHPSPVPYCETHARIVADEDCPEYIDSCPNCGCMFGIN